MSNEINETLGRSYDVPEDLDESDLMAELDGLEDDMAFGETEADGAPSYLQVRCMCVLGVRSWILYSRLQALFRNACLPAAPIKASEWTHLKLTLKLLSQSITRAGSGRGPALRSHQDL